MINSGMREKVWITVDELKVKGTIGITWAMGGRG